MPSVAICCWSSRISVGLGLECARRRLYVVDLVARLGGHCVVHADRHVLGLVVPALKDEHGLGGDVEAVDEVGLALDSGPGLGKRCPAAGAC